MPGPLLLTIKLPTVSGPLYMFPPHWGRPLIPAQYLFPVHPGSRLLGTLHKPFYAPPPPIASCLHMGLDPPSHNCPEQAQPLKSYGLGTQRNHTLYLILPHPNPHSKEPHLGTHQASNGPSKLRPRAALYHSPVSTAQVIPTRPTPLPPAHAAELPGARASCGVGRPAGLLGASVAAPA